MKKLNLILPEKSNIPYKISKFPDGQQDVTIQSYPPEGSPDYKGKFDWTIDIAQSSVQIVSRFNNFQDLEIIICATKALRELKVKEIHLFIPYLLGARSDRKFQEGGTSYLRDVIAPIINAQNFETVTVFDVHSNVASAVIPNLISIDNKQLVEWAIANSSITKYNAVFVSPDAGASHKIYKLATAIGFDGDIITCSKERDVDGKLTKCVAPVRVLNSNTELIYKDKSFVIVDDICDGGATFINIAKEIKKVFPDANIYLIVTHGIFSKGFKELSEYFDGVYTTNSYRDIDNSMNAYLHKHEKGWTLIKQLSV